MIRRLVSSLVLVLVAFASAPLAAGHATSMAPAPTAAAKTVVVHLRPVGAGGKLLAGFKVTARHSGANCSSGSEAIGAGGYRCFAGNGVYDPCWVSSNRSYVYCLAAAWSFDVARLHVTKGYDNHGFSSHVTKLPWGLELANGTLCGGEQGATGVVDGKRISFGCQHVKYVLIGGVDKHNSAWRIRKARSTGGGHFKLAGWVNISKAWLGKPSRKG
jgi:hypothetical protein